MFARDATVADAWLASHEPLVHSKDVGVSSGTVASSAFRSFVILYFMKTLLCVLIDKCLCIRFSSHLHNLLSKIKIDTSECECKYIHRHIKTI